MKKRKELNALIGIGGDSKRKKTKKGSGHRLLRTEPPDSDSESSSDDDEFSNISSVAAFGKRSYAQCCSLCYPLCAFVILAACVMACAGLVWMQIALKEDLDSLKEKFHIMDSGQKASAHELPRLGEELKDKGRVLEDIVSGDRGLSRLWANLTEINRKISALDSAVNHLKANIKSASDLINLPTTVEELQKSVATIGSTLTSVQHDLRTVQTDAELQKQAVDLLKSLDKDGKEPKSSLRSSAEKPPNCSTCTDIKQEMLYLQDSVGEVNSTQVQLRSQVEERMSGFGSSLSNLSLRVSSLESGLLLLGAEPGTLRNASSTDSRAEMLRLRLEFLSALSSKSVSATLPEPRPLSPSPPELRPSAHSTTVKPVQHLKETRPVEGGVARPEVAERMAPAQDSAPREGVRPAQSGSSAPTPEGSTASDPTRRPAFLSQSITKKDLGMTNPVPLSFPGVHSLSDFEKLFAGLKEAPPPEGWSYEELRVLIGEGIPDSYALQPFDQNGDKKFSKAELQAAAGV
ncbi:EF-hand calcium-binding domain-containing protein 14 isoform X1 [Anguilla rostrata]|uniref:EF-hand calcium-binding domain-containing protein 14 isoform X1 n=1 Tax=Anguilla rostrata TaxID=7938 RepID=UPI0030CE1DA5